MLGCCGMVFAAGVLVGGFFDGLRVCSGGCLLDFGLGWGGFVWFVFEFLCVSCGLP